LQASPLEPACAKALENTRGLRGVLLGRTKARLFQIIEVKSELIRNTPLKLSLNAQSSVSSLEEMKQNPPLLRGEKLKSKAKLIELSKGCVIRYNKGELFIY
jgi:hypothetical protein